MSSKHPVTNVHPVTIVAVVAVLAGVFACGGCRTHMPHAVTWPAGGDIQFTHPKPPEGGYYKDWDPYAASIELTPVTDVNVVGTQHILIATVRDHEGEPLPNRRVEWIISEGSIGDIVEVDSSGWRASRGYKVDNHFAVSHTNNYSHVLDRGNDDPADDIHLEPGQTWCVITSPVEGDTFITAYAPGIYDWSKHKVFATKHWYDVMWEFPPAATNPTGTPHQMTTMVMKASDGMPLVGHEVTYEILDGPAGTLSPGGGRRTTVLTDEAGAATVTLNQDTPAEGTNNIQITIVRPENVPCCRPPVFIAEGMTSKTWIGPRIAIEKSAPARALINEQFEYHIAVSNPSEVNAEDVVVTDVLPDGIAYVSSTPAAQVGGQSLTWSMGQLGPNGREEIAVVVRGTRTGQFNNCADVRAAQNLEGRACAETVIVAPELYIEKQCPSEVLICDPIPTTIVVHNRGDGPATNVRVADNLPDGLTTQDGQSSLTMDAGTLEPGQSRQFEMVLKAARTGTFENRASATADGGLSDEATCTVVVRQPVLAVTKEGPDERYIGRTAEYRITVSNTGDAPANQTVLTDTVPAGMEFVSASDGGQFANNVVTWNLETINPDASRSVTVTLRATQRGEVHNVANARAICAEATAEARMAVKGIAAILLEVVDDPDPIEVGSNVTYTITVTNQGSSDGTNIVIVCTLSTEQEYVSVTGPTEVSVDGQVVTFAPLPELDPKAQVVYRVVVKGSQEGDVRFTTRMTSDQLTSPVMETEATRIYR